MISRLPCMASRGSSQWTYVRPKICMLLKDTCLRAYSIGEGASTRGSKGENFRNLPSEKEAQRSHLSRWVTTKLDELQEKLINASQTINDVTGYSSIAELRKTIEEQEQIERSYRLKLRQCRKHYEDAINKRSGSQQEMNELLQRKSTWSSKDLERFTNLYKNDHVNESAVVSSQEELADTEMKLEDCQESLSKLVSRRYREEQIWSDKIRRASTYGTWALMAFNIVLFVVVQLGLEPWRRRRLVASFEEKVKNLVEAEAENEVIFDKIPSLKHLPEEESSILEVEDEGLTWRTLPNRISEAFKDQRKTLLITPLEALVTSGFVTGLGAILGALLTVLFM